MSAAAASGARRRHVDYGRIYEKRFDLLHKAFQRGWKRDSEAVADFAAANARWLPDYALFMACKRHFGMKAWTEWPDDIRLRQEGALEKYRALLQEDVDFFTYLQYLFFQQWDRLAGLRPRAEHPHHRRFAHLRGHGLRRRVGRDGVFPAGRHVGSQGGVRRTARLLQRRWPVVGQPAVQLGPHARGRLRLVDTPHRRQRQAVRCHPHRPLPRLRQLLAVPYGETTAKNGKWVKGPGMDLVGRLNGWFPQLEFIAEDLATPPPASSSCCTNPVGPG